MELEKKSEEFKSEKKLLEMEIEKHIDEIQKSNERSDALNQDIEDYRVSYEEQKNVFIVGTFF